MGLGKNNTDLEEISQSILNLENTSQEIKVAVEGIKTDITGAESDIDIIGVDLTTVKNNIGTPTGGKTVISMINELSQSSGGEEILFVASNSNILISKQMEYESPTRAENTVLEINGKPLYIFVFGTGNITINITGYASYNNLTTIDAYDKSNNNKLGSIDFEISDVTTKSMEINVYKGLIILFKVSSRGPHLNINKMDLLATIQKVDMNKALAFNI